MILNKNAQNPTTVEGKPVYHGTSPVLTSAVGRSALDEALKIAHVDLRIADQEAVPATRLDHTKVVSTIKQFHETALITGHAAHSYSAHQLSGGLGIQANPSNPAAPKDGGSVATVFFGYTRTANKLFRQLTGQPMPEWVPPQYSGSNPPTDVQMIGLRFFIDSPTNMTYEVNEYQGSRFSDATLGPKVGIAEGMTVTHDQIGAIRELLGQATRNMQDNSVR